MNDLIAIQMYHVITDIFLTFHNYGKLIKTIYFQKAPHTYDIKFNIKWKFNIRGINVL